MSGRARAVVFAGGALIAVLLIATVGWVVVNSQDVAASDVSDLIPDTAPVPNQDNAYLYLSRAVASFQWPRDKPGIEFSGEEWDDAFAADMLYRNSKVLSLVEQGLACPAYCACATSVSPSPGPQSWDRVSILLAQKAAYEGRMGLSDAACETSCGLLRLGSWITSRPRSLDEYFGGLMALELGLEGVQRRLHEARLDEAELVMLSERLNRVDALDRGLAEALKMDFQRIDEAIEDCALRMPRRSLLAVHRFQPNRTRATSARFYRRLIQNIPRIYADVQLPEIPPLRMTGIHRYLLLLRPNRQGRMLEEFFWPRVPKNTCFGAKCGIQSDLDGLRLAVACRLYEARHGRLPERLDALVPELLSSVPRDPFDGKPFRYVRERAVVYSVGADLKDSAGSGEPPSDPSPVHDTTEPPDESDWPEYQPSNRNPLLRHAQHGTDDMVYRVLPETK